ncbi:fibronectin type III domain protein [Sulfuricaulis limicola]|uniref:Fibronectin type III domain protein n=1 Tax=Sulfuricaulis limicola TaxID=1620215 RepID=A0A1B4XGR3_9GAMM|nr:fibronectin type III domain protein [Sulfuricaulis limicola]
MRIVSSFKAAILSLALPALLTACGGGAESPPSATSLPNAAALTWDAVPATNLSGYRVYYGTTPGTYQQAPGQGLSVGNITTYTLMGLSNGTRYYFAVTAFDTAGNESGYSNEVFKDIP